MRTIIRVAIALLVAYAGWVASTWLSYGRTRREHTGDPAIAGFMPDYEVRVEHRVSVSVPADVAMQAVRNANVEASPLVRLLFNARAVFMGARPRAAANPLAFVAQMQALGWAMLADDDRRIILGTVTKPWEAEVVFRRVEPAEFAAFDEPGYAKIVVALDVEEREPARSIVRTETRVVTTDSQAREKFRAYWATILPGVLLVLLVLLSLVKRDAENLARQ